MTAPKVDVKTLDHYRARPGEFRLVDVPGQQYLMVDGRGDPNSSPAFGEAVATLYPVAYAIKFASKVLLGRDYVVPPLEGLWWAEDMSTFTSARDKSRWLWTLMIMVPDWVGRELYLSAVGRLGTKQPPPPRLADLRLTTLVEGRCLQTLHVGAFDDEAEVLARLHHEVVPGHGFALAGRHHEIYLSDVRRTAPDRQRTLLRQPVVAGGDPGCGSPASSAQPTW